MGAERSNGHDSPVSGVDGASRRAPRRRRRWWLRILLVVVAAVAVCAALEAVTLLRMRDDLQAGRRALEGARRSLLAGNVDTAASDFAQAGIHFGSASRTAGGTF